jgi:hypothetical protein
MNILKAKTFIGFNPKEYNFDAFEERALFQTLFVINNNLKEINWKIEHNKYARVMFITLQTSEAGKLTELKLRIFNPNFFEIHFTKYVIKKRIKLLVKLLGLKL